MLYRRAFFGLISAALIATAGSGADAGRYVNQSGLAQGSFVWNPTVSPEGALSIVVSPAQNSVHVYRNGVEIGISTMSPGGAAATSASGVFLVQEIAGRDGPGDAPGGQAFAWSGMELFTGSGDPDKRDDVQAVLPVEFARLLMEATQRGAAVIVARERSGPQVFSAPGPFIDPLETGSLKSNRVARFARPELRDLLEPAAGAPVATAAVPQGAAPGSDGGVPLPEQGKEAPGGKLPNAAVETGQRGEITSLILSRADLSAYVMKDGRLIDRLPIAVDEPTRPFGLHAAVLVSPGDAGQLPRWLAFGLDEEAGAAHVAADGAADAMRRVRFLDRGSSAALARRLKAGTVVVLMDGHGPSVTVAPRFNVALLTSEGAAASAPAAPATADRKADGASGQRQAGTPGAGSVAAGAKRTVTAPAKAAPAKRKRGPLDQREAWPNSMYWPY